MGWLISLCLLVYGLVTEQPEIIMCSAVFACAGSISMSDSDKK